jgi:hypothetical protein
MFKDVFVTPKCLFKFNTHPDTIDIKNAIKNAIIDKNIYIKEFYSFYLENQNFEEIEHVILNLLIDNKLEVHAAIQKIDNKLKVHEAIQKIVDRLNNRLINLTVNSTEYTVLFKDNNLILDIAENNKNSFIKFYKDIKASVNDLNIKKFQYNGESIEFTSVDFIELYKNNTELLDKSGLNKICHENLNIIFSINDKNEVCLKVKMEDSESFEEYILNKIENNYKLKLNNNNNGFIKFPKGIIELLNFLDIKEIISEQNYKNENLNLNFRFSNSNHIEMIINNKEHQPNAFYLNNNACIKKIEAMSTKIEGLKNYFEEFFAIDNIKPDCTVAVGDSDGSICREILAAILADKMLLTEEGIELLYKLMEAEFSCTRREDFQIDKGIYDNIIEILNNAVFKDSNTKIIFLGDSVFDRFTNNKFSHMLFRLVLVKFCGAIYIKGNHDDLDTFLEQKESLNKEQFGGYSENYKDVINNVDPKNFIDEFLKNHINQLFNNCYYDDQNKLFYIHNGLNIESEKLITAINYKPEKLSTYQNINDLIKDLNEGTYKQEGTSFRPSSGENMNAVKEIRKNFGIEKFVLVHGHSDFKKYFRDVESNELIVINLNSREENSIKPTCSILTMAASLK